MRPPCRALWPLRVLTTAEHLLHGEGGQGSHQEGTTDSGRHDGRRPRGLWECSHCLPLRPPPNLATAQVHGTRLKQRPLLGE